MPHGPKLRIAQVAPVIFPVPPRTHGGTERVVADLGAALVAHGHDVTLFAAADSTMAAPLVAAYPSLAALEAANGRVPPGVPAMLETALLDLVRQRAGDFDVIHCHGDFAHAAVLAGARTLTTLHWRVDELDRQMFFAHFSRLAVTAVSSSQARTVPPGNLAGIVHHGIDAARYRLGRGDGRYLAFIGRMTDQKRPDAAIRIAAAAGMAIRLAGTLDVGNPGYFDTMVGPLLGGDAVYVGAVDDAAKQVLLGNAAALLFPVDWPEPFGLVMIEAMACGTPVIAFRRGSVAEVVDDGITGFIVDTEGEAAAAVARAALLDRGAIRARFEARFGASRMATDYIAVYRSLIARR